MRQYRGVAGEGEVCAHLRRGPARESRSRRDYHARSAQLSCRVAGAARGPCSGRGGGFLVRAWWPVGIGIAVIAVESTRDFGADRASHPLRVLVEAFFGRIG